jgi:cysteine-S-conjugate beta-lyase
MKYDFDRIIKRTNTNSVKWDLVDSIFDGSGLLPLWVADMDFESPPEVVDALVRRAGHGIFGYTAAPHAYFESMIRWFRERHAWDIKKDWIHFSPGVVPALNLLVQTFTEPGDRVIIQQPVYYPFMYAIRNNGREITNNALILEQGRYRIDLADLEQKAQDPRAKLLILCSPHNPVGRVWTEEELKGLGDICMANNLLVISDEIHCDLVYPGNRHIPFASITDNYLKNSITCLSPSKTFNLAGLQTASLVIAKPELQDKYRQTVDRLGLPWPNLFGCEALTAAYSHGGPWLEALMEYLTGNLCFLKEFIKSKIPEIEIIQPEGTYLVWLDFRKLGVDKESLKILLRDKAHVALDHGFIFGSPAGDGFERINIACPRQVLNEALTKIEGAIRSFPVC